MILEDHEIIADTHENQNRFTNNSLGTVLATFIKKPF